MSIKLVKENVSLKIAGREHCLKERCRIKECPANSEHDGKIVTGDMYENTNNSKTHITEDHGCNGYTNMGGAVYIKERFIFKTINLGDPPTGKNDEHWVPASFMIQVEKEEKKKEPTKKTEKKLSKKDFKNQLKGLTF